LKKLSDELSDKNSEEKIFWKDNYERRLEELSRNLDDTIDYLSTCGKQEFLCAGEVLDELSEHFKSKKLIECVEANLERFHDEELKKSIEKEVRYMKKHL